MLVLHRLCLTLVGVFLLLSSQAHAEARYEDNRNFTSYLQERNGPVVMIFPGAGIEARRYGALAEALIQQSPSVNVMVAKFTGNYANPLEGRSRVDAMLQHLAARGWRDPAAAAFLAGHSLGGIFAPSLVNDLKLGGLILMGAYLQKSSIGGSPFTVASFPRPILVLNGDLDGRVELWHQSREFRSYKAWAATHPEDFSHLVVTLMGVNHTEFADGHVMKDDIKAELPLSEAHKNIAEIVTLFTRANTKKDLSASEVSTLNDRLQWTSDTLNPVEDVERLSSSLCASAQQEISGLQADEWQKVKVESKSHSFFPSFVLDKSKISHTSGVMNLYVPYYVETPPNPFDISGNELGQPITVACKMRSRESVLKTFELEASTSEPTCAELNQRVLDTVFDRLSFVQKLRFAGSGVSAEHRVVALGTGIQWISKSFRLTKLAEPNQWIFEIPELKTSVDFKPQAFAGAHYCKLIAPERALQWFTRDILQLVP